MVKQRVLLTGATGGMGQPTLKNMVEDLDKQDIVILARKTERDYEVLKPYENIKGIEIIWGDLTDYNSVLKSVKDCDIVLHIAAFVSPAADYNPELAMKINYGSTKNIIKAIYENNQQDTTKFVYIGTVAETGDRMPPIHRGRIGDPIKPSVFDYYAVSKVVAERLVIESGLKYWVSHRQTGIIGKPMSQIEDAIMFHNCFDNVLEYCSDRDSAIAMKNLCSYSYDKTLDEGFWGHIYNIGGGESCRIDTYNMYKIMYKEIGLTNLDYMLSPKKQATLNFHGQYYLDSDKLESYLHFRKDSMQYFYDCYLENLGYLRGLSFEELYKITGCQFQPFNTIYQLYDDLIRGRIAKATDFLMIPEYLMYKLTGKKAKEYTNAVTTGLVNATKGEYESYIINSLGLLNSFFRN